MTLWQGRLSGGTADVVMQYSTSLHYDRRLALDDLVGSRHRCGQVEEAQFRWRPVFCANHCFHGVSLKATLDELEHLVTQSHEPGAKVIDELLTCHNGNAPADIERE